MKKNIIKSLICICALIFMAPNILNAQSRGPLNMPRYDDEPYHFGFILGYNQMLLSIDYIDNYQNIIHSPNELPSSDILPGTNDIFLNSNFKVTDINPQMTHGFSVGIVGNLRLAKYFDLRLIPTLSFGERRIMYKIVSLQEDPINGSITEVTKNINSTTHSTFIEFPLQVKYRSKRYNNSAAYIIAGANYKIDMASQKKYYDETSGRPKALSINRHDLAAEVGAGFDFYTGYFKLGVELKMSYGLLNVAKKDNYMFTNSFDNLRNKTFQLSFTFE
ncbi:MAG: PorT family protein [Lentimicrobiaceae bacterium]|nr:PorT family protein [Lentimicrobiaceae bacterium]